MPIVLEIKLSKQIYIFFFRIQSGAPHPLIFKWGASALLRRPGENTDNGDTLNIISGVQVPTDGIIVTHQTILGNL
jgi:hypothetical protein